MPFSKTCAADLILILLLFSMPLSGQQSATNPAPDDRLKADILLIVAHPDDESLIAGYLARAVLDEHKRVAVVFATRGDAGQNLVGNEQAQSLAEVREMEGRQALSSIGIQNVWFLRAPDTPYPDVPDVLRSLEAWNHGYVLGEVVRFVRLTRPDVVISMLPVPVVGENHEDHQAAGVVATEAFDLAGDPTCFPEQIGAPEDRLWFANLREGLRPWQPKKLYFFTDASHFDFLKGKGPQYSMTEVSSSQHVSYGRLAAMELSYHRTQYGDEPTRALESGNLGFVEQPLGFVLGKSLVGGDAEGDLFQGIAPGLIPFARARGYQSPLRSGGISIELGGGWAFYKMFWPAHDLIALRDLLAPEEGIGGGQNFPVPLILHNDTEKDLLFHLRCGLPSGWSLDTNSGSFAHHSIEAQNFLVRAHEDFPIRIRIVAAPVSKSVWQEISWTAEAKGETSSTATLRVFVEGH